MDVVVVGRLAHSSLIPALPLVSIVDHRNAQHRENREHPLGSAPFAQEYFQTLFLRKRKTLEMFAFYTCT
jgi:hypothetical protein